MYGGMPGMGDGDLAEQFGNLDAAPDEFNGAVTGNFGSGYGHGGHGAFKGGGKGGIASGEVLVLDHKSCEMIADDLYTQIAVRYPNRKITINVSEDGH